MEARQEGERQEMRICAATQGEYGQRIVANIREHGPQDWEMLVWEAPRLLPIVVDDPEEFLPESPPQVDLILSLVENRSASELIPDLAVATGAQAVIAPVDNRAWLPRGMMRQVGHRLASKSISSAFPVPFCSLEVQPGQHPLIQEFATHFGRPKLDIEVVSGRITRVDYWKKSFEVDAQLPAIRNPMVVEVGTGNHWTTYTAVGSKAAGDGTQLPPLRLPGKVEDIANMALFLASEEANHITGETFIVRGAR